MARLVLLVVLATGAGAWLAREALFGGDGRFALLTALVSAGAALMGMVRGLLAAQGRFVAIGALLVAENLVRCAVAVMLFVLDVGDPFAYGIALVLGYVACAGWPSAWRPRPGSGRPATSSVPAAAGAGGFLGGAAAGQVLGHAVLTGGPVLLALMGASPADVTVLFATLALYRAPYTVLQGQVSQATGALARLVVEGRMDRMARIERGMLGSTLLALVVGAGVGAGLGPRLVALVFGAGVQVDTGVSVALALGSVLALATLVQGVVLLAYGRPQRTLYAWLLALVPAAAALAATPGSPVLAVAVAFVVAEGFALLFLVVATRGARASLSRP